MGTMLITYTGEDSGVTTSLKQLEKTACFLLVHHRQEDLTQLPYEHEIEMLSKRTYEHADEKPRSLVELVKELKTHIEKSVPVFLKIPKAPEPKPQENN